MTTRLERRWRCGSKDERKRREDRRAANQPCAEAHVTTEIGENRRPVLQAHNFDILPLDAIRR
jgi:hypothetical protein